jgi:hypothetical protein
VENPYRIHRNSLWKTIGKWENHRKTIGKWRFTLW